MCLSKQIAFFVRKTILFVFYKTRNDSLTLVLITQLLFHISCTALTLLLYTLYSMTLKTQKLVVHVVFIVMRIAYLRREILCDILRLLKTRQENHTSGKFISALNCFMVILYLRHKSIFSCVFQLHY